MKKELKNNLKKITSRFLIGTLVIVTPSLTFPSKEKFSETNNSAKIEYLVYKTEDYIFSIKEILDFAKYSKKENYVLSGINPLHPIYRNALLNKVYAKVKLPDYITKGYIKNLIECESSWDPAVVSKAGAKGLGQLIKKTWNDSEKEISYEKGVFIPEKNLEVSLKYLNWLNEYLQKNHNDWQKVSTSKKLDLISAAYNGGITRLKKNKWNIQKMPRETRKYVKKINEKMNSYN